MARLPSQSSLLPPPDPAPLTPRQWLWVVALSLTGVVLRTLYVLVIHPAARYVFSDMAGYVYRAVALARGQPQTIADTIYPPGMSLFLAALFRLDPHWRLAEVVQCGLSIGIMGLVWLLARRLYGNRVAVVALAAIALYLPMVHYAGFFLAENPFAFLILLTLWLFVRALDATSPKRVLTWALLGGLCAGAAGAIKTTVFGPLAVVGTLYALMAIRSGDRRWLGLSAATILGVAACVIPMSLHCTRLTGGQFCLIATNGPINIVQGHYGRKFMFYWNDDQRRIYSRFGSPTAALKGYTDSATFPFGAYESSRNMALIIDYVEAHPGAALQQSVVNVADLFTGPSLWPDARLFGWDFGRFYQRLYWFGVLPVALGLLALGNRSWLHLAPDGLREWLLIGPLFGLMALAFIAEGEVRYRIPFDSLILILAAAGYVALVDRARTWLAARRGRAGGVENRAPSLPHVP